MPPRTRPTGSAQPQTAEKSTSRAKSAGTPARAQSIETKRPRAKPAGTPPRPEPVETKRPRAKSTGTPARPKPTRQPISAEPSVVAATDLIRLTDPRAIRALAHPARLAVLEALDDDDTTLTATQAGEITGLSPSAMSYHLRALAKWGIVRPAVDTDAADGRERRWQRGGSGLFMDSLAPGTESATAMITAHALDLTRDTTMRFLARSAREAKPWRDHATISAGELWLTEAEAAELSQGILAIVDRFRLARRTSGRHPDGARLVRTTFVVVPTDEPAGEPDAD